MKELIPMDEYGVFADTKDRVMANSLKVAEMFRKRHADVLRDVENLECSQGFSERNFALSSYKSAQNKKQPCYNMTRDGFTFLVMGYRGKKAAQFKEAYISRFNEMEQMLEGLVSARHDYPMLMEAVKMAHDEPKYYHFSNEADLLNRIVLGCSARQFREEHGIEKGASIRPHLNAYEIELLEILQKVDTGLLISVPDYEQRKRHLEWYKLKHEQKRLIPTA